MSADPTSMSVSWMPEEGGLLRVRAGSFCLQGRPSLCLDGTERAITAALRLPVAPGDPAAGAPAPATAGGPVELEPGASLAIAYHFGPSVELTLRLQRPSAATVHLQARLALRPDASPATLTRVSLLETAAGPPHCVLGGRPEQVASLEQAYCLGRVRPLAPATGGGGAADARRSSELVWVAFDRQAGAALLAGWVTSERWLGRVHLDRPAEPAAARFCAGSDGGDLRLDPGADVALEELMLSAGPDPWALLEQYAETAAGRHPPEILARPPVSWCSWYPYRLGVSEERVLAEARMAAGRLKPLGLTVMEIDLGWQAGQLSSTVDENDRFGRGLAWLAAELEKLGLQLGVWTAPYSIAARDPVVAEHPEYLVQDEAGHPARHSEWYWEPHGDVYILDLTHPGARALLAARMASLRARGVRYLKADFLGCAVSHLAKRRHDPRMVGGGGLEASRAGAAIVRQQLPEALVLNCGGPPMPGTGHWPLLYACGDTGNTGYIRPAHQQETHQTLACHLFMNRRWGIIQPSCLCVGLPGTLEEARLRATAAFMAGGQIDISDTLTTLPEDRWAVLTATLPPLGRSARPVDLFAPVDDGGGFAYATQGHGEDAVAAQAREHPPGSVWHLHVDAGWDEWELVAVFAFAATGADEEPRICRFALPLARCGRNEGDRLEAFEFWSAQYLGAVGDGRRNAGGYAHPGDTQDLLCGHRPDWLELAFFGPAAKLVRLWRPRPHPWIAGTTFHQSCGTELQAVAWEPDAGVLRGRIDRPAGERGLLVVSGCDGAAVDAAADGRPLLARRGARGVIVLPLEVSHPGMEWQVRCRPHPDSPRIEPQP